MERAMDFAEMSGLERKFCRFDAALSVTEAESGGAVIEGYASLFGARDQGGDVVEAGAYAAISSGWRARGGGSRCSGSMTRPSRSASGTRCARMAGAFTSRGGFWTRWSGRARRRR